MTSKPVAQLLLNLGVDRSHSRLHVANDNPCSEAAFKALKYGPVFPTNLGPIQAPGPTARPSSPTTTTNRRSGIGLRAPASVHYGAAAEVRAQRQVTLDAAYAANPERFTRSRPKHRSYPPQHGLTTPHGSRSYRLPEPDTLTSLDNFRRDPKAR